jgi:hypothetical protein
MAIDYTIPISAEFRKAHRRKSKKGKAFWVRGSKSDGRKLGRTIAIGGLAGAGLGLAIGGGLAGGKALRAARELEKNKDSLIAQHRKNWGRDADKGAEMIELAYKNRGKAVRERTVAGASAGSQLGGMAGLTLGGAAAAYQASRSKKKKKRRRR